MNLESIPLIIQWLGGLLAYTALGIVLYGVCRSTHRRTGHTVGLKGNWLRSWRFYLASSAFFFSVVWLGMEKPVVDSINPDRAWMLALGSLLYFSGLLFLMWAQLTLGKDYFVSTGFGAKLFEGHQLITGGPYSIVLHPIYAGLFLAALGCLLIYTTCTTVYFACFALLMFVRARSEEVGSSAEFGEQWKEYCRHVPSFIPRLRKVR